MTLKKPSDIFDKKPEDLDIKIVESDNTLREELVKVENLSEQVIQLQQELSQKIVKNDLESLVLSQINTMKDNFDFLQNDFKKSNKKDILEFKGKVSELTEIVGNLVENELPKYKKQVTKNEVRIGERFSELKEIVENNIIEVDEKIDDIAEVIDNNLDVFNRQIQENFLEVKKTSDTYNKLSNIIESKVSKENDKLEEYSQVIQSIHKEFVNLEKSIQEKTLTYNQIIEDKFESISSNINNKIDNIDEDVKNKINTIDDKVDTFKSQVSSEVSNIKTDVVIFEKHNKDTQKTIQEFSEKLYKISEIDSDISNINEDINKLNNQYGIFSNQSIETKKDLEVVERYIQKHHKELLELKEEVFGEIEKLPLGNIQENLESLEKKIDYIKETYSKIEPEVIVKEVIKEGLLNEPPDTKNTDPLTPLNQNFVTLEQLQQHYRLFINRIQQQISTIGGGGETRLKYLDDIVGIATNASAYDDKFLKYNHSIGKFEFVTVSGGGGGSSQWVTTDVGIHTLSNVGIGTTNPTSKLHIVGDARITGILTIGTSSLVFDGTNNKIYVGSGVTISATEISIGANTISSGGFAGNASSATYATNAGIATYATSAGLSTYATNAGIATYATNAGIATYATNAGIATYATNAGISTTAQGLTGTPNLSVGIITATQLSTGESGTGVNISTDTISGPSLLYIDPAAVGDNTGAVRIKGDLYVDGTQFIVNSTTIEFADFNVGIATTVGTNALLDGAGIGIGSTGIRKTLTWNNSSTALKSSEDFDIASGKVYRINGTSVLSNNTLGSNVTTSSLTSVGTLGSLSVGNVNSTGIITAISFTGNASSATYATNAGVSTYATNAGIATSVIGGIASVTSLSVSGVSTVGVLTAFSIGIGTTNATSKLWVDGDGYFTGILTANRIISGVYGEFVGGSISGTSLVGTSLSISGISTLGVTSATNLTLQQLNVSGITTLGFVTTSNIYSSGVVTATTFYGSFSGNASSAGIATYATSSGIATYATSSGIATYASTAGIATSVLTNPGVGIATAGGTVGTGVTILDFRGAGISTITVASGIATINTTGGSSSPDISSVMMSMIF